LTIKQTYNPFCYCVVSPRFEGREPGLQRKMTEEREHLVDHISAKKKTFIDVNDIIFSREV
jgi:hypothetical protein